MNLTQIGSQRSCGLANIKDINPICTRANDTSKAARPKFKITIKSLGQFSLII
jgi:hypothetical protein